MFGGHSTRQLLSVLLKVNKFSMGDRVRITTDPSLTGDIFKASGDVEKVLNFKTYISNFSSLLFLSKLFITVCRCSWYGHKHSFLRNWEGFLEVWWSSARHHSCGSSHQKTEILDDQPPRDDISSTSTRISAQRSTFSSGFAYQRHQEKRFRHYEESCCWIGRQLFCKFRRFSSAPCQSVRFLGGCSMVPFECWCLPLSTWWKRRFSNSLRSFRVI